MPSSRWGVGKPGPGFGFGQHGLLRVLAGVLSFLWNSPRSLKHTLSPALSPFLPSLSLPLPSEFHLGCTFTIPDLPCAFGGVDVPPHTIDFKTMHTISLPFRCPLNSRCAVASETSIRQGLMYAMSAMRDRAPLQGEGLWFSPDDAESQALMCSLFSAIAIGGLMLGCPVATVARHMDYARQCKERFGNLADKSPTIPALILYAMSHAFIGSERSDQEYREALLQAKVLHNGVREKDPVVSCFTAYRNFHDRMGLVTLAMIESNNPFSSFRRVMDTAGMTLRTERARRVREEIARGGQGTVHSSQEAHPCFVLVDGKRPLCTKMRCQTRY